jgi:hypothetical protein
MSIVNDLQVQDRQARLPIAYGRHPVKGFLTKHIVENVGTETQVTIQRALGAGPWDSKEKLYYGGEEIADANNRFHQGTAGDVPDDYFPDDIAHPNASYESSRLPVGMADDNSPDKMVGIYKTLQVANYDGAGVQTAFGYSPSPARHLTDLMLRARRSIARVGYPAWIDYRDYCAENIDWDDGALTPHFVTLAVTSGGALTPGSHLWARIATLKAGDISSASRDRADDGVTTASIVVGAGGAVIITWASQAERGADGYRVYLGATEGAENVYFDVVGGATNTLTVTTLAGATSGVPPEIATGALLRQIPRFESHIFLPPPFGLATALDKLAQITCMDWQYANGVLVLMTPEIRIPVLPDLNLAEITNFKTYQVDRGQTPNQIIVNYRDLDQPDLRPADPPVVIPHPGTNPADPRIQRQLKEGIRTQEINGGGMYRSQAERVGTFWYRRLVESDQMFEGLCSPKNYTTVPGDVKKLTHNVPNWTNVQFCIEEKEEAEDSKAGYQMKGRLYGAWYSDTDHSPLPRPLPVPNPLVFSPPPVVTDVALEEAAVELTTGAPFTVIRGGVQFAAFAGKQRGRVWIWRPDGSDYEPTDKVFPPEPTTLQGAFEITAVAVGLYKFKVVTESELGVKDPIGDHPEFTITVTGELVRPMLVTDIAIITDASNDSLVLGDGHPRSSEIPADYVIEAWVSADRSDPANLKKILPVTEGSTHAALLVSDAESNTNLDFPSALS